MSEHPVARKLGQDILPWLVAPRHLRRTWWYVLGQFYIWLSGMLTAVLAAGFTFATVRKAKDQMSSGGIAIEDILSDPVTNIPLLCLLLVHVVKVAVLKLHLVERVTAADLCLKQVRNACGTLHVALASASPMRQLDELYESLIAPTVQRANNEEPSSLGGLEPAVGVMVDRAAARYVRLYGARREAPPPLEREPGGGGGGW